MVWLVLALGVLITGLVGMPVGVGLGLTGLTILHFFAGGATPLAITTIWNVFNDFLLSAIPMFIFMGEIMLASGVSKKLYSAASPLFRRIPGGLLHTNIAVCTIFGAVSGASTSTAAAVGAVAYPELKERGYDRSVVVGTLAAGGTLGLLIPPSLDQTPDSGGESRRKADWQSGTVSRQGTRDRSLRIAVVCSRSDPLASQCPW